MTTQRIVCFSICGLLSVGAAAVAQKSKQALIAEAESAGPTAVTASATIKDGEGNVLREGTNGWTCYPGNEAIGPMCNQAQWDAVLQALMAKEEPKVESFSISYMLAGEGDAVGVSNSDPFATDPASAHDHVKEGPHLMIVVPDPSALEGISTDPNNPVYVMWSGTPYAHIMVKIAEEHATHD